MHRLAVALAALALCAGCSSAEQAGPAVPPLPSASSAPSPSVSAFPETPQGAADFARFVYAEIDRAYTQKDPAILEPLFAPDCQACENFTGTAAELRAGTIDVTSEGFDVISAEAPGGSGTQVVAVRLDYSGAVIRDAQGNTVLKEPAGELQTEVSLLRSGSTWQVSRIARVEAADVGTP